MTGEDRLLLPSEAAAYFGVDPRTLKKWVDAQRCLTVVRTLGGHRRFLRAEVEALAKEQTREATP